MEIYAMVPECVRGLIFDLDGTLADTMSSHVKAWSLTGRHFGVDITAEMINEMAGAPSYQVIKAFNKRYGWDIDPLACKTIKSEYYLSLLDELEEIQPISEVYELVKHYHGRLPMAIGTGSSKANADRVIRALGLDQLIPTVVSADDVLHPKPHPETFLTCARLIGINPADCLVFEDGPLGIQAAVDAGMKVMVLPEFKLLEVRG
jgi:beta-phosphoglucomutase family hydrolase